MTLALLNNMLVGFTPLLALPGEINGYLTVPTAGGAEAKGEFVVQAGSTRIEAGVEFFVMKSGRRGTIVCTIEPRTGRYEAKGIGSVTLRAWAGGQRIERELTLRAVPSGKPALA